MDSILLSSVPHQDLTETPCPICGEDRRKFLRTEREYPIWKCASCNHLYASPRPSEAWLKRYYSENWPAEQEERRTEIYDAMIRAADRYRPARGDLLDVGMGAGGLLERAAADGWRIHGLEADDRTFQAAVASLGENAMLYNGMFETVDLQPASYDCIVMVNVIEHVIDPKAIFRRAFQLLRPGGCLAVRYPDCRRFLAAPAHLHNFSRKSTQILFQSTGFTDVRFFYASSRAFNSAPLWKRTLVKAVRITYRSLMFCTAGGITLPYVSQLAVGRVPPKSS